MKKTKISCLALLSPSPSFKQPFGAQQVACHMFLSSFLPAFPCFPRETELSHPQGSHRGFLPQSPVPRAAHSASVSLKFSQSLRKARALLSEFKRGHTENASRDAGDEANGRCGEWQVCSCGML